jgi:predicted PurR-regulated permease PerM
MGQTAKRVGFATVIVIAIVASALVLWELRLVLALVFLGFILAAAMRPGIDALRRNGVPRALGLTLHYILAVPLVAVLVTVLDVVVRQKEPAEEEVPTVLFPAREAEN